MFLQHFDGMVGQRCRGVKAGSLFYRGQLHIVPPVANRIEKPSLIFEQIGAIKPVLDRHAVDVPFSRVIRPVSGGMQHLG